MGRVRELLVLYAALFLTGFPLLFFCLHGLWSRFRGSWAWDKRRKLLFLNALLYPLIFSAVFILLIQLFGVRQELQGEVEKMALLSARNIQQGAPAHQNNPVLGALFLGLAYLGAALIPTTLLGFLYSAVSTALLLRHPPQKNWAWPFFAAGLATLTAALLGFILRTPILNWIQS